MYFCFNTLIELSQPGCLWDKPGLNKYLSNPIVTVSRMEELIHQYLALVKDKIPCSRSHYLSDSSSCPKKTKKVRNRGTPLSDYIFSPLVYDISVMFGIDSFRRSAWTFGLSAYNGSACKTRCLSLDRLLSIYCLVILIEFLKCLDFKLFIALFQCLSVVDLLGLDSIGVSNATKASLAHLNLLNPTIHLYSAAIQSDTNYIYALYGLVSIGDILI